MIGYLNNKLIFVASLFVFSSSAFSASQLSKECLSLLEKTGDSAIRLLDGRDYDGPVGVDLRSLTELPMTKHPDEKRLKYRVFETMGSIDQNEYLLKFKLSGIRDGGCYVDGLEIFHRVPYEQQDSGIKFHNANLK